MLTYQQAEETATMFQTDRFIEDCRAAVQEGQVAVRAVVEEAVADPRAIAAELGEPTAAGVQPLYRGPELTVINFVWAPYMTLMPHNHNMFAVIGLYNGREDNVFWRRIEEEAGGAQIEAAGADSLGTGDVATLGRNIIHSVANPISKLSAALHVYAGDFFDPPEARAQWDHETLREQPWNVEDTKAAFRDAEIRFNAGKAAMQDA